MLNDFARVVAENAAAGGLLGAVGTGAAFLLRERSIRKAVDENNMGFDTAVVGLTKYKFNEASGAWEQSLRTLYTLDLDNIFKGMAGRRYLKILKRAAERANQSDNPYVLDHLEWAIKTSTLSEFFSNNVHPQFGNAFQRAIESVLLEKNYEMIRYNIIRIMRNEIATQLHKFGENQPHFFEGIKEGQKNVTVYFAPVSEKESKVTELKILIFRQQDLNPDAMPQENEPVHVETGPGKFEAVPGHLHNHRAVTNRKVINRMNADGGKLANDTFVELAIPLSVCVQKAPTLRPT